MLPATLPATGLGVNLPSSEQGVAIASGVVVVGGVIGALLGGKNHRWLGAGLGVAAGGALVAGGLVLAAASYQK